MSEKDGGPAFPNKAEQCNFGYQLGGGMTLRDYFAAKAMQSFIVRGVAGKDDLAKFSYAMADLMLEARK